MIDLRNRELNIKDFVIEVPNDKKDLPFDPLHDIPPKAWEMMTRTFRSEMDLEPLVGLSIAADMRLLSRNNPRPSLIPSLTEGNWDTIDSEIVRAQKESNWDGYIRAIRAIRTYDPQRAQQEQYSIDDNLYNGINEHINLSTFIASRDKLLSLADLKLTKPEKELDVPSELWDDLFEDYKSQADSGWANKFFTTNFLAAVKIIDPKRFGEQFVPHPPWSDLKEALAIKLETSIKSNSLRNYSKFAQQLMILAAEEINMTGNGLELKMPAPTSELDPKPEVPVMRKF